MPTPPQLIYYELAAVFGKFPHEVRAEMEPDEIMDYWHVHLKKMKVQNTQKKGSGTSGSPGNNRN